MSAASPPLSAASPPMFLAPTDRIVAGDRVVLDGPEGRHAATVRRVRPGERVDCTDGAGLLVRCQVTAAGRDRLDLAVLERDRQPPPQPRIVVIQALPKADRGELAVELLTEVGVDEVVPWAAARCVQRWSGDRGQRALARWRSVAREAAKQSRRTWLPAVAELASTAAVTARLPAADLGVVLHPNAAAPLAAAAVPATGTVVIVVGPEGGLDAAELDAFAAADATAYRLGPTVLRTSTAGVVAVATLLARSPRWTRRA